MPSRVWLRFRYSENYVTAEMILDSNSKSVLEERAQLLYISGDMNKYSPLQLEFNCSEVHKGFSVDEKSEFERRLRYLNDYMSNLTYDQSTHNFIFDMFILIDYIDIVNKFLREKGLVMTFTVMRNVKYKYQKKLVDSKVKYIQTKNYWKLCE